MKKVYFAGKVSKHGWRDDLLGTRSMSRGEYEFSACGHTMIYGGPFAISCDHGCFHKPGSHAMVRSSSRDCDGQPGTRITKPMVFNKCLDQLSNCDAVVAYLESMDAYGTMFELGFAFACGKPVLLFIDPQCAPSAKQPDELWFIRQSVKKTIVGRPRVDDIVEFLTGELLPEDYKETLFQPSVEDWCCPKCRAGADQFSNGDDTLLVKDIIACKQCGHLVSGKDFVWHLVQKRRQDRYHDWMVSRGEV